MIKVMRYRIALTEAGLPGGVMRMLGLPIPTHSYRPYSVKDSRSDGGTARHGYKNAELLFQNMTPAAANILRGFVDDAKASASGLLFITMPKWDGTAPGADFIDLSGRPDLSDIAPQGPINSASGVIMNDVILRLNNITVLNTSPTFN